MKHLFLLFAVSWLGLLCAHAAPVISYLIPDIGTPGMNTYVEIIGPYNTAGNFGTDGVYLNDAGDAVRVVCVNNADTDKIKIGPVVVSWNGKMIATQVFVMPGQSPNSSDWQSLTAVYRIPIKVIVSGASSSVDSFYIVKPQAFGTKNTVGVIGSGGTWGKRSRRGAMIVDSMILNGSGAYRIDTADCNPATTWNDGYLPTVIISTGTMSMGTGATISISAPDINGAPGGGGGGHGEWTPCTSGIVYGNCGQGFSKGGGYFDAPTVCDPNRNGINNCPGGECPANSEGGGGGTGMPFSSGGHGAAGRNNNCSGTSPAYSGGGGGSDLTTRGGGGGGFGSAGTDATGCPNGNGGSSVGNMEIVPLSGGSGGGGGNGYCCDVSGSGGGGGGAIALYGRQSTLGQVDALGANGTAGAWGQTSGCGGGSFFFTDGGGGSGGGILVGAKAALGGNMLLRTFGGAGGGGAPKGGDGGAGRARYDGPLTGTITSTPGAASWYRGLSTDTSKFVPPTFTLTGSGNGNTINIYVKAETGPWQQLATVSGYTGNAWSQSITLPGADTIWFLAAAQQVTSPSTSTYTAEPQYVLSQAAANILRSNAPSIASVDTLRFGSLVCDSVHIDTMWVHNVGNKLLTISAGTILGVDAAEFTILAPPSFPQSIPAGDSLRVIVRLVSSVTGGKLDTLSLVNDDPATGHNPWRITLTARKEHVAFSIPDTLRADTLHSGRTRDTLLVFRTTGTTADTITTVTRDSGVAWISYRSPVLPRTVQATAPTDTAQLRFRIAAPRDTGWFSARFRVHVEPCGFDSLVTVRVYLVSGIVRTASTLPLDSLLCGAQLCKTYMVHNDGNGPLLIDSLRMRGADSLDFGPVTPSTARTVPAKDSLAYTVCFTPRGVGAKASTVRVFSDDSMSAVNPAVTTVSGKKDSADFRILPPLLDLGDVCVGTQHCDQLTATNIGTVTDTLTRITFTAGSGAFSCTAPAFPTPVAVGGVQPITMCLTPPDTGVFIATFAVSGEPCGRVHAFSVRGRGVRVDLAPLSALTQWGDVRTGTCRDSEIVFVARGFGSLALLSGGFTMNDPAFTILGIAPAPPRVVQPGDTIRVRVRYCPSNDVADTQSIQFAAVTSCAPLSTAMVTGRGVSSSLLLSKNAIAMDSLPCGGTPMVDTVFLTNTGTLDLHVTCAVTGADAMDFALEPPSSFDMTPSGTARVIVRGIPHARGIWHAELIIASDDPKHSRDTVALTARRDSIAFAVSPGSVNFGDLPACLVPADTTIILCNTGTVEDTVTASSPAQYRVVSALPRHIPPGACDTIIVRFAPILENVDLAEDLVFTSQPCALTDTVHLRGRADRYVFIPDTLDFGNTQVGDTVCLTVAIVNHNARAVRIAQLSVTQLSAEFTMQSPTLPFMIAPHDSLVVAVCYAPSDSTALSAMLRADVDVPCMDTIRCALTGHGIRSDLTVAPRPLDFGVLDMCTAPLDSVQLCNRGSAPIVIATFAIGGTDAATFSLVNAPALPWTLIPGGCQWIVVRCDTGLRPEGTWRAVLAITPQDPAIPVQTVNLQVVRRAPILAVPTTVDFGTIDVGQWRDTIMVVHNTGALPLCIDTITSTPEFTITTGAIPVTLAPGDSLTLNVRFRPTQDSSYAGSIALGISCPCPDLKLFALYGTGRAQPVCTATAVVALDTIARNVGEAVDIATILKSSTNLSVCGASQFAWTLRYRHSLLVPIPLRGRDSAEWHIIDGIAGDTAPATAPVHFVATLGDTDATPLYLQSFTWTNGTVATTTVDGLFRLANVCPAGGKRLVNATGTFALAQNVPNPFTGETTIEYELIESGRAMIRVYDLLGRTVAVVVNQDLPPGRYRTIINGRMLPAGVYRCVLETTAMRAAMMMVKSR